MYVCALAVQATTDTMKVFNVKTPRVHLDPGQPTTIHLTFVPLKIEPRYCIVLLSNTQLGDIVASVSTTVKLPFPGLPHASGPDSRFLMNHQTKTLHLKAYAGEKVSDGILLTSQNPAFENAVMEIYKWGLSDVELKQRTLTSSLKHATLVRVMASLGLEKAVVKATAETNKDVGKLAFKVSGANNNFEVPKSAVVPVCQNEAALLPVQFQAKEPGQYECHMVLTSTHDIRVFVIESTVMAQGSLAELEFCTAALKPLTQEIPLVSQFWTITL